MDVCIDAAGSQDPSFSREYFGGGANFHGGSHPIHDARITRLADRGNPAITNSNISLIDSGVIENQRVGNHQIGSAAGAGRFRRLAHAVANDFAAAELYLIAVDSPVCFDFDNEVRISEAYPISRGRAVMLRVRLAVDFH